MGWVLYNAYCDRWFALRIICFTCGLSTETPRHWQCLCFVFQAEANPGGSGFLVCPSIHCSLTNHTSETFLLEPNSGVLIASWWVPSQSLQWIFWKTRPLLSPPFWNPIFSCPPHLWSSVSNSLSVATLSISPSVMSDSLPPHGLWPPRLPCSWGSPGKNTGVGCHALLPGIFLTQRSNPYLLHWHTGFYH